MVRLFRSVAAALFTASAAIALAEQPQISETSLLLPYFSGTRPVRSVLSISSGCWQWLSPNGLGIISVEPTPTAECSDGTSSSATVTVASKNLKRSAAVVLAKNAAGKVLRCDVNVGRIASLEIRTVVEALYVGSSERVELTGLDAYNNTFSTLEGMVFQWSAKPAFGDLMSMSKLGSEGVSVSSDRQWAEERGFADSIVVRGLYPGPVLLHAKPQQDAYADLPLAVKPVQVIERLRLAPPGPVCVAPGTSARFTLLRAQATGDEDVVVLPSADFQWHSDAQEQVQSHPMLGAVRVSPSAAGRDATIAVEDRRLGSRSLEATVHVRDMASISVSLSPLSAPALGGVRPLPVPPSQLGDLSVHCSDGAAEGGGKPYSGTPLNAEEADETLPAQCVQRATVSSADPSWRMVAGAVYQLRIGAFTKENCPLWLGDNVAFNITASEDGVDGDTPFRVLSSDVLAAPNGVVTPLAWETHPSVASVWGEAPPAHPIPQSESDHLLRSAAAACSRPADATVAVPRSNSTGVSSVGRVLTVVACRSATLRVDIQPRMIVAPALPAERVAGIDLSSPSGARFSTRNISRRAVIEAISERYSATAVMTTLPTADVATGEHAVWVATAPRVPVLSNSARAVPALQMRHPTTALVLPFGPMLAQDVMYTLFPSGGLQDYSYTQAASSPLTVLNSAHHNVRLTAYNRSSRVSDSSALQAGAPFEVMSGVLVADRADPYNALFVPVVLGEPAAVHMLPSLRHTQDGGRIILATGAATASGHGYTNCSALSGLFSWGQGDATLARGITEIGGSSAGNPDKWASTAPSPVQDLNQLSSVLCSQWQDYPGAAECHPWQMYHPPAAGSPAWAQAGVTAAAVCSAIAPTNVAIGTVHVRSTFELRNLSADAQLAFSPRLKVAYPASAYDIEEQGTVVSAPTPKHAGVFIDAEEPEAGTRNERRWGNVRSSHSLLLPLGTSQAIVLEGGPMFVPSPDSAARNLVVRAAYELKGSETSHGVTLKWLRESHEVNEAQVEGGAAPLQWAPYFMLQATCPQHAVPPTMFQFTVSTNSPGPVFQEDVFVTIACKAPSSVRPRIVLPSAHAQEWTKELFEPAANSRESDIWLRSAEQMIMGTRAMSGPMGPEHRAETGTHGNAFSANESSTVLQAPLAEVHQVHYLMQADLYDDSTPPVKFSSKGGYKIDFSVAADSQSEWLAVDKLALSPASAEHTFLFSPRADRPCATWPPVVADSGEASCGHSSNETAAVRCEGAPKTGGALACLTEGALDANTEGRRLVQLLQHAVFASEVRVLTASFTGLVGDASRLSGLIHLSATLRSERLHHEAKLLGVRRLDLVGVDSHTDHAKRLLVFRHPHHIMPLPCQGGTADQEWFWASAPSTVFQERNAEWQPLLVAPQSLKGLGTGRLIEEGSGSNRLTQGIGPQRLTEYTLLPDYCRGAESFAALPRSFALRGAIGQGSAALLLAVAAGKVDVSCYDRGLEAAAVGRHRCAYTRQLTAHVQPVHRLNLRSQTELYLGLRVPLGVAALNAAGEVFSTAQHSMMNITFQVSDARVLDIQTSQDAATGERSYTVRAKSPGTAELHATMWNCALTGAAPRGGPPSGVRGCPPSPAMHCTPLQSQKLYFSIFQSLQLHPRRIGLLPSAQLRLQPSGGPALAKRSKTVWSSSNEDVAIVSGNGTVTAIAPGYCTITVTALGAALGSDFEVLDSATAAVQVGVPTDLRIVGPPGPVLSGSVARLAFRGGAGLTALSLHGVHTSATWRVLCPRGILALRAVASGDTRAQGTMLNDASVWVQAGTGASVRSNAIVTVNVTIETRRTRLFPAKRIVLHAQLTVPTVPRLQLLSPLPAAPVLAGDDGCVSSGNASAAAAFSIATHTGAVQESTTITVVQGSQLQLTTSLPADEVNFKLVSLAGFEPSLSALTASGWAQVQYSPGRSLVEITHVSSQQVLHVHIVSAKVGAVHLLGSSWLQFGEETASHRMALISVEGAPISLGEGVWTGLAGQPATPPAERKPAPGSGPVPVFNEEHMKEHGSGPLSSLGVFVSRPECVVADLKYDGSMTVRALSHGDAVLSVWLPHIAGQPASGTGAHALVKGQTHDEMMFMPGCTEAELNDVDASPELLAACVVPVPGAFSAAVFTDYLVVHASSVLRPAHHVVLVVGGSVRFELVSGMGQGARNEWSADDANVLQLDVLSLGMVAHAAALGQTAVHLLSVQSGNAARAKVPVTVTGLAKVHAEWMGEPGMLRVPLAPVSSSAHVLGRAQVSVTSHLGTPVLLSETEQFALPEGTLVDHGVAFRCSLPPGTPAFLVAVARGQGAWNGLSLDSAQVAAVLAATGVDVSKRGLAKLNAGTTDEADDGAPECLVVLVPGTLEPRLHVTSPVVVSAPPAKLPSSIKLQVLAAPRVVAPLDAPEGGVSFLWHRAHGRSVNSTLTLSISSDVALRPFDVRGRAGVAWLAPRNALLLSEEVTSALLPVYGSSKHLQVRSSSEQLSVELVPRRAVGTSALGDGRTALLNITVLNPDKGSFFAGQGVHIVEALQGRTQRILGSLNVVYDDGTAGSLLESETQDGGMSQILTAVVLGAAILVFVLRGAGGCACPERGGGAAHIDAGAEQEHIVAQDGDAYEVDPLLGE